MGGRLSKPQGVAGSTESSVPAKPGAPPSPKNPFPRRINSQTIVAPAAAATMALILFVYARTSIRAAKANAQRHRDADTGGEGLSLLAEHRRRHGLAKKVEGDEGGTVRQLGKQLLSGGDKKKNERGDTVNDDKASGEDDMSKLLKMKTGGKGKSNFGTEK